MTHARAYIIIGVLSLLLASCGQQQKSQSIVDDFIDENMVAPEKIEDVEYSKLDSTKTISDSTLLSMRQQLKSSKIFKPDAKYSAEGVGKKLFRLRVNYKLDGNDKSSTFYLDEGLNGVVAVKND